MEPVNGEVPKAVNKDPSGVNTEGLASQIAEGGVGSTLPSTELLKATGLSVEPLPPKEHTYPAEDTGYASGKLALPLLEGEIRNFDHVLNAFPIISQEQPTLIDIESLEPGTYALLQRPSVGLLRQFPRFRNGSAELGILCLSNKWLLVVGKEGSLGATPHHSLLSMQHESVFQAAIHSHPGDDIDSEFPSDADVSILNSTIDGYHYIVNSKGLLEYHMASVLPGGYTQPVPPEFVLRSAQYWITHELKLNKEDVIGRNNTDLRREFYKKFFGLRSIPWENEEEIENILASKEKLVPVSDRKKQ